jgi:hypothetical protein
MLKTISISDVAEYQSDADAALRVLFSSVNPNYAARFVAYLTAEVATELAERLVETDTRLSFVVLSRVEAALRKDYLERCRLKMSDEISIEFRKIHKRRGSRARLEEDIIDVWYDNVDPPTRQIISRLRGMLRFRHWIAHGRYWNVGARHNFQDVYLLADAVLTGLPLRN